ncbi:MAG: MBL fold metallo-hydrolase [Clostridiales bacterium]|jgi:glyoxylase-like metal-dependent hydrolase (beta-lactamase superfamily II)|nr:MBL fold metallo-hydrolase [Clostridiales bacterium]
MEVLSVKLGAIRTNCYIAFLHDGGECVVIDPGAEYNRVRSLLEAHRLSPVAVLFTHGHFDHTLASKPLQAAGATVYIHNGDFDKVSVNKYKVSDFDPAVPDVRLKGGERLSLAGIDFEVIHTPGHTKGCVCYLAGNALFSGDTLFCGDIGRTDLDDGDYDEIINSIKSKLLNLPDGTVVYPGHDASTTIGAERKNFDI